MKRGGWIAGLIAALAYLGFLGGHWLRLDYSDKELAGFVSRLWDIRQALADGQGLPWWTPFYMSGSSYGLHHSQGLYLVPSLMFSVGFDLLTSVKLTALLAMLAGTIAMFACARYFLQDDRAAALAALAWLLHPQQIIRAAGAEHLGIIVFMPFVPLTWLWFARALDSGKFRDAFGCALAVAGGLWAHNKMAFVNFVFLAGYFAWWVFSRGSDRARQGAPTWPDRARQGALTCVRVGALALALGAFFIVPGLMEAKHVKLFAGDPIEAWQKSYAFKSLFALVDRNGAMTRDAVQGALGVVNARGGVRSQTELEQIQRAASLPMDSPEKYAGLVLLAVVAVTMLANHRRVNRGLFWSLVGALLLSVMLAYGRSNVWSAHQLTWSAMMDLPGIPGSTKAAVWLALLAVAGFLVLFYRRKLTTPGKRLWAAGALLVFLFLPAFDILAAVPFFKEIRAPFVFYDVTAAFLLSLLAGFFVTDVLGGLGTARPTTDPVGCGVPPRRVPVVVGVVVVLLVVDYWPYQKPMKDNGVPARTLANLRAAYGSLRADPEPVKVYALSGRYFHLLGPMLSGKPQVWEAFYNWMAPQGTGWLNTQAGGQPVLFNLLSVRYILFDKSDPNMAGAGQVLQTYRQLYPVHHEDEDFVIFRNPAARPFVRAYAAAAAYVGEPERSVPLSLALSEKDVPLIYVSEPPPPGKFLHTYRPGDAPIPSSGRQLDSGDLRVQRVGAGTLEIENATGWLVIAESYYPFWRAMADSQPLEVARAHTGLLAVNVPPAVAKVTLEYRPPRAYVGALVVSAVGLVVGGWVAIRGRMRL